MTEPLPLPPVEAGVLDAAGLEALLRDLEACARVQEVQIKGAARAHAAAVRPDLPAAAEALRARACRGVQVRYAWDGVDWCDTILVQPGPTPTYRVVRMQAPTP